MAIIPTLIAAISRRLAALLRAILGWSVTALFGRLGSARQTALTLIVVLSVLWPLLVAGVFAPPIAAWAIAFVPLHKWFSDGVLRVLWLSLAIATPPLIGLATARILPRRKQKGGVLRTVVNGFPLTLGYLTSFFLTAIVVAAIKVRTMTRRWVEEHIIVQPAEDHYHAVLAELRVACERAGLTVIEEPVPSFMSLPTRILKALARGAIDPIVPEEPRRLRAATFQAYLYPSDLLLRGRKHDVARVRAELTQTQLDRHAYLVASEDAQHIQSELQKLWVALERHFAGGGGFAAVIASRLEDLREDLKKAQIPFEEWVILDRIHHRLEHMAGGIVGVDGDRREQSQPASAKHARRASLIEGALGGALAAVAAIAWGARST